MTLEQDWLRRLMAGPLRACRKTGRSAVVRLIQVLDHPIRFQAGFSNNPLGSCYALPISMEKPSRKGLIILNPCLLPRARRPERPAERRDAGPADFCSPRASTRRFLAAYAQEFSAVLVSVRSTDTRRRLPCLPGVCNSLIYPVAYMRPIYRHLARSRMPRNGCGQAILGIRADRHGSFSPCGRKEFPSNPSREEESCTNAPGGYSP